MNWFRSRSRAGISFMALIILGLALAACNGEAAPPNGGLPPTGDPAPTLAPSANTVVNGINVCPQRGITEMTGAGATFPFPLLSSMLDEYQTLCGTRVNYQSIGSGGGITQVQAQTVHWGASEAIMNEEQRSQAQGGHVLHVPFVAGAVAPVYNLPGIPTGTLKMSPDVLADIYLKNITRWNDPRLVVLNPDLELPDRAIAVVHRSDGSGTTFVFTHYLSQVSEEWESRVGYATSVAWPGDVGGPGNEGVANQVRQIQGAIGYVERAYALQTNMPWVVMQNQSGNFIEPTRQAAALAADVPDLPDNMEVMVTDTPHPEGYPITGFAWLLIYENQRNDNIADAVARMSYWMLTDGQRHTAPLEYVPIEGEANAKALCLIGQIKYTNGDPVLPELSCN
jgi:phosphate transport system substrate-binding protein